MKWRTVKRRPKKTKKQLRLEAEATRVVRINGRQCQLLSSVPDLLLCRAILYVGANGKRMEMVDLFDGADCAIDALEIWPDNVAALRTWNEEAKRFRAIIEGDIVTFVAPDRSYDAVLWWHGPEHVEPHRLDVALANAERLASRLVVLACPWGDVAQSEVYGNPFEEHRSALLPVDFWARGYETNCIGEENVLGSNLIAWKRDTP